MKILILTDSFNHACGRSRYVAILAKSLQDLGHFVYVIFGGGDGSELLQSMQIPFEVMPSILHSNRTYFNFFKGIKNIYLTLKVKNFDVIHVHHFYVANLARIASILLKIPQVMTIHSSVNFKGMLFPYVGDYFIAVSDETKKFVINEKPYLESKIVTIPSGIEINFNNNLAVNKIKKSIGIDSNSIIVSIIGRVVYQKGHIILLKSLEKLHLNLKVVCLIVGDGEDLNSVKNYANNLKIKTLFSGNVKDTHDYFMISDIVALPSVNSEGLPITLLEAGKYSTAVVASAIGGIKNVIIHRNNGYLVSPGNIQELSKALKELIESVEIRNKLGNNLRKTIETSYRNDIMVQSILKIYEMMLKLGRTN